MQDVVVGYLHGDQITQEFHHCLFRVFVHDLVTKRRIRDFIPIYSNVNIGGPRNRLVRTFLETKAEWLWMLDSDATFSHQMIHQLLAVAGPDMPIVGALAHRVTQLFDDEGQPIIDEMGMPAKTTKPVAYRQIKDDEGNWVDYTELETHTGDGLFAVDATGCHCLLVHRSVFEKLSDPWFREAALTSGITAGEDITFCLAARDAGFPVYIDARLRAGHVKSFIV